jgi:acyl-CoA thioesterase I
VKLFFSILFSFILFNNCYTSKQNNYARLLPLLNLTSKDKKINVTIIGDSLSERSTGFGLQTKLGNGFQVNDYSISGRNTLDWLNDISRPFQNSAEIIIIELGTNDAYVDSLYNFSEKYSLLIKEIELRSKAKLFLTAVSLTNEVAIQNKIKKNNDYIKSLSKQYFIVDLETLFEEKKKSIQLYPVTDPIHPNSVGYELIGEKYKLDILSQNSIK